MNLTDTFITWIFKPDHSGRDYFGKISEEAMEKYGYEPDYPNALDGLEFILDHCSCVEAIRDEYHLPKSIDISFFGTEYFGTVVEGEFEITKQVTNTVAHPQGHAYERAIIIVGDFKPIISKLIIHTLKRVPNHKIERFLMERI
jgi:hypothetical protein